MDYTKLKYITEDLEHLLLRFKKPKAKKTKFKLTLNNVTESAFDELQTEAEIEKL